MSTIVVADDEPSLADLLAELLQRLGHDVTVVLSGQAALDACADAAPDLVVLDVGMPGDVDGLEATRRLRTRPETARVPILLLTARGSEGDVAAGFAAGANDYLVKPFGAQQVRERVTALLEATA